MTRATVYVAALLDLGVAAAVGAVGAALKAAAGALTPWILAVVLLALRGPEEARAQRATGDDLDQKSWAGLMTGGYSTAIGDDFGGGSSVGFTAGLYRIRSPTFKLGVEVGYDRLGGYTNTYFDIHGPGITQIEKFNWSVLRAAAVARVQLARSSTVPLESSVSVPTWSGRGTTSRPSTPMGSRYRCIDSYRFGRQSDLEPQWG